MHSRWYATDWGRFLEQEELRDLRYAKADLSLYRYGRRRPLAFWDRDGKAAGPTKPLGPVTIFGTWTGYPDDVDYQLFELTGKWLVAEIATVNITYNKTTGLPSRIFPLPLRRSFWWDNVVTEKCYVHHDCDATDYAIASVNPGVALPNDEIGTLYLIVCEKYFEHPTSLGYGTITKAAFKMMIMAHEMQHATHFWTLNRVPSGEVYEEFLAFTEVAAYGSGLYSMLTNSFLLESNDYIGIAEPLSDYLDTYDAFSLWQDWVCPIVGGMKHPQGNDDSNTPMNLRDTAYWSLLSCDP